MPASSEQPPKRPVKGAARKTSKSDPPAEKPFLRFYHSEVLRVRTLAVLARIEEGQDSRQHRDALSEVIMELNGAGMEYYYLRPLGLANVSSRLEKSARIGIGGVVLVMTPVIRTVIKRMKRDELLSVCRHMREIME